MSSTQKRVEPEDAIEHESCKIRLVLIAQAVRKKRRGWNEMVNGERQRERGGNEPETRDNKISLLIVTSVE